MAVNDSHPVIAAMLLEFERRKEEHGKSGWVRGLEDGFEPCPLCSAIPVLDLHARYGKGVTEILSFDSKELRDWKEFESKMTLTGCEEKHRSFIGTYLSPEQASRMWKAHCK